jgi:peptidoglycan/LPS O-acetylase OafA/YrhL
MSRQTHVQQAALSSSPVYFSTIQVLRGVAALLVVLYHLVDAERIYGRGSMLLDGVPRFGFAGVDVFFVISGFVMVTIAAGQFGSFANAGRFLVRRAFRILPLYWVFTTLIVLILVAFPTTVNDSYHANSIVASYLLWPQSGFPLLQVGWTLIFEAFFYVMMSMAIATLDERFVPVYLLVWAIVVGALQFVAVALPWQAVAASPMAWEFIAGALIGLCWKRLPSKLARTSFWIGVVGFLGGAVVLNGFSLYDQDPLRRTLVFGSCSVLIVLGLVLREHSGAAAPHPWLRRVGDASYSIYLSHLFVVTAAARAWGRSGLNHSWLEHVAFIVGTLIASALAGIACYRLIERPLLLVSGKLMNHRAASADASNRGAVGK